MDQLRQQIARARSRLILEQFLGRLVWCLLGCLTLATIAIAAPRIFTIENLSPNWDMAWLLGALGVGFLIAAVWTFIKSRSPLDAAIEIDRRFDLRERVASSLSLSDEEQSTAAGRAVVNDALRAVKRIDVDEKFRVKLDRRAWWPLVPAAIVFVLVTFVDYRSAQSSLDPNSPAVQAKQNKQSAESLRKKIAELTKKSQEKDLKKAENVFKQIEQGVRELEDKKDLTRSKAAVKLNNIAKQLEERRQQLGGKDGLKEQFQNMKNLGAGPAEKAAQAMKQGDWQKALKEFEKLAKDLKEGKLSDADKEKLMKQLQQMKDKLEAANDARKQAMEDLKKQIDEQKRQGNVAKAGELQQKLDQMQKQQQQMDKLQQMAQQMAQMQQALQQGDNQKASDAMSQMAQQLSEMQQDMNEMEMLDAAMEQLEMAKDAMACESCSGEGCAECQGNMAGMNSMNYQMSEQQGRGMGAGRGIGDRPDEENATNLRDTRVRQKPRQGAATFGGMVEGPNLKGEVAQSIKEEMETLSTKPADPLTNERLTKSRRQHAEEYFKMLREGKSP
jgi:tetratricopeptide (TPR) repeat protein